LLSAVRFFFATGQIQPNSYLLSVLGFSALFAFLYYALRRSRFLTGKDPKGTVILIFTLAMFLFCLVIAFFNFGMFDRYITSRLSLPLYLYFIILVPYMMKRLRRHYTVWTLLFGLVCAFITFSSFDRETILKTGSQFTLLLFGFMAGMYWLSKKAAHPQSGILLIPLIYILTVTMPVGHSQRYSKSYKSANIIMEEIKFIEERQDHEKILFVSGNQYSALLTQTNSTFIDVLKRYPNVAFEHLRHKMYTSIYISRRFERNAEDGEFYPVKEDESLDQEIFITETVYEKPLNNTIHLRFERLVEVHLPEEDAESSEDEDLEEVLTEG